MTAEKTEDALDALESYPSGVAEQSGRVPLFLKLTYVGFVTFGILYLFLYFAGDGSPLVDLLNQATGHGLP